MSDPDYLAAYAWAQSNPELADKIAQAKQWGWTAERFQAEIQTTQWYRSQQDSARDWEALKGSDPAQAQYLADQRYRKFWAMADAMGVKVTDEWMKNWTELSLRYGWSEQQMRDVVADTWQMWQYADTGGTPGLKAVPFGQAAGVMQEINALVYGYGVPVDDATKQNWMRQVLSGKVGVDSFKGYLAQIAAADNPWMKEGLDAGFSVRDILAPYVTRAAQELGISPDEIDLSDPKWRQLLEVTDKDGNKVRPDTRSILRIIRTDDRFGWDKSDAALDAATTLNQGLLKMFGAVG